MCTCISLEQSLPRTVVASTVVSCLVCYVVATVSRVRVASAL